MSSVSPNTKELAPPTLLGQIASASGERENSTKATTIKLKEEGGVGSRATAAFSHLYSSSELADVSLMVEGTMVKAHKVVLALSSPYFKTVFEDISQLPCSHHHPVVVLRGVSLDEWEKLRKLIYCGSVRVAKNEVESLVAAAGRLKIAGLEGSTTVMSSHKDTAPSSDRSQDVDMEIGQDERGNTRSEKGTSEMRKQSRREGWHADDDDVIYCPQPETMYGLHDDEDDDEEYTHNHEQLHSKIPSTQSGQSSSSQQCSVVQLSPHKFLQDDSNSSHLLSREQPEVSGGVPLCLRYSAEEVNTMVAAVENFPGNTVPCAICRKYVKRERLRAHINECHLLDGRRILCPLCGMALRSKGSYRVHIWRHRRGTLPPSRRWDTL